MCVSDVHVRTRFSGQASFMASPLLSVVTLICGTFIGGGVLAQVPPAASQPAVETVTAELIQTRRQQAEQATDLDDATKQKILQTYDQAMGMLDAAAKSAARAAELQALVDSAPKSLRQTKEKLAALSPAAPAVPADGRDLQELKQILAEKEKDLSQKKETLDALKAELGRRVTGRKGIADQRSAVQKQLPAIDKDLRAPADSDAPPAVVLAQRTLLLAHRQSMEQSISAYEKELAMYDATADLLPLQQQLVAGEVSLAEEEVSRWRQLVNRRTEQETKRQAQQARIEALRAKPPLQPLTDFNRELAEKGERAAQLIRTESEKLAEINKKLEDVKQQFERTQQRVKAVGLTNAVGMLMRTRRAELPNVGDHYRAIRARQSLIRDVQTELFDLLDRQSQTLSFDRHVASTLREIRPAARNIRAEELEEAVRDLLTKQGEHLRTAISNQRDCLKTLVDLDDAEQKLIREIEQYAAYIDERVLWIRSARPLRLVADLRLSAGIARRLLSPQGWTDWVGVVQTLKTDVGDRPWLLLLALCVFGPWLYRQRRLRDWLTRSGEQAARSSRYQILPTLYALLLTILISAIWPAIFWYLAWRLTSPLEATDFAKAVAAGLSYMAGWFLPLECLRQLCRPKGLAEAHFDWPAGSLRRLGLHLRWLVPAGLPFSFTIGVLDAQGIERWHACLGRLSFIAMMILIAAFVHLVFRPSGELFRYLLADGRQRGLYRFRYVLYTVGLLGPLSLAVLAAVGFFYTAYQLAVRMRETVYLPLALAVVGAVLARWVLTVRRRLAIQMARQRRAASEAAGTSTAQPQGIRSMPGPTEVEPDLTAISAQTRRLLNSFLVVTAILGIWWIWVDVLPALAILDRVELWSTTVETTELLTAPDGSTTDHTIQRPEAVTLADLGLAILVLLMTVIAARNVPGLLEISMPQQLPLDAGARYAITTMARYLVIAVGVVIGCRTMGIGWSKVQWLIAALTVGLGFGLQEIFANFVSGLIILFERPIRVGDVVTVDDVSGVVTRIQTRATTVTNWDRKEFIVPNKEFITGRLLNWTRSDHVNRVVINVGIAYGSDTERATQLLEKVVTDHPEVMEDPAPLITFEGFGDSSLSFVVRCYLAKLDKRLQTIHDLHTAIDKTFREAGIEIAFPQRDIHVRSGAELLKDPQQQQAERPAK